MIDRGGRGCWRRWGRRVRLEKPSKPSAPRSLCWLCGGWWNRKRYARLGIAIWYAGFSGWPAWAKTFAGYPLYDRVRSDGIPFDREWLHLVFPVKGHISNTSGDAQGSQTLGRNTGGDYRRLFTDLSYLIFQTVPLPLTGRGPISFRVGISTISSFLSYWPQV